MKALNRVQLLGYLGQNPLVQGDDKNKASMSLATSVIDRDKNEHTVWHKVTAYSKLVDIVKGLSKGDKVFVEGSLQTIPYQDAAGKNHYSTHIIAHHIHRVGRVDVDQNEF